MKLIKVIAAVTVLLVCCAVSYQMGTRSYKDACLMSDAIRLEYDNLSDDEKNCTFTAYSALEEACQEEGIDPDSLLKKYVWCY